MSQQIVRLLGEHKTTTKGRNRAGSFYFFNAPFGADLVPPVAVESNGTRKVNEIVLGHLSSGRVCDISRSLVRSRGS